MSAAENVKIGTVTGRTLTPLTRSRGRDWLLLPERAAGELGVVCQAARDAACAVAPAEMAEQQVFVLDEPSEHLDAETAAAVLDDIWATTVDAPVLVITHDADVVARCDRVVRLG